MATRNYIVLANSDSSLSKQFKVVQGTLEPKTSKMQTIDYTLGGRLDVTEGPQPVVRAFTVKTYNYPTGTLPAGAQWGVLDDLKVLYRLRNPLGTPSHVITLVDHLGASHTGYLVGDFSEKNITPSLDGPNGEMYVACLFQEIIA